MNILMIMADQMAAGALGAYGHPIVRTPHIDALATRGVLFENCYCNSPLCVPSRASMFTGRLPCAIDSFDNGSELPATVPTFVHWLRRAGYRTAVSGKMHFIGPDQLHGFEERLTTDIYPASVDWTPDWRRGAYGNPGASAAKLRKAGLTGYTEQMRYDDNVQRRALEHLERMATDDDRRPFFLCVSFTHPHDPFQITEDYWRLYADERIDMPAAPAPPPGQVHEYNRWINTHHELDVYPPNEDDVRRARHAYYAMVSYVDEKVGELIERLSRLGLAEDTTVLFTSDHGEMLGEHGMWSKRTFYERATRVPLAVCRPGRPSGRRVRQVVSLVDLFPTILELAGVAPDGPGDCLDGHSIAGALDGDLPDSHDTAICEYSGEGPIQPMRFIRRGRHKYVFVAECPPLLFDLESDPLELANLAGTAAASDIERSLHGRLLSGWDPAAVRQRVLRSQQERLLLREALSIGRPHPWAYAPPQ